MNDSWLNNIQEKKLEKQLKPMGFLLSMLIYVPAAILMFVLTKYFIPYLSEKTGMESILFWFLVAALGIFLPMAILTIIFLKKEGFALTLKTWKERLRFRKITKNDLIWTFSGILGVLIFSGLIMKGLEMFAGKFDHTPSFMSFEPLTTGRYWILAVWFPYWILNIMGEEIFWRGIMMPRQEVSFGKYTWIIHGFGWGLFHIAFGWQLLITLIPIIFIQSFVVQKTKNSWTGVIMHGGINGPSFIAIALGLI